MLNSISVSHYSALWIFLHSKASSAGCGIFTWRIISVFSSVLVWTRKTMDNTAVWTTQLLTTWLYLQNVDKNVLYENDTQFLSEIPFSVTIIALPLLLDVFTLDRPLLPEAPEPPYFSLSHELISHWQSELTWDHRAASRNPFYWTEGSFFFQTSKLHFYFVRLTIDYYTLISNKLCVGWGEDWELLPTQFSCTHVHVELNMQSKLEIIHLLTAI